MGSLKRLKAHKKVLNILLKATPNLQRAILKKAPRRFIDLMGECCLNYINNNVKVTPSQKKKLQRHTKKIKYLANSKNPVTERRKTLQDGGFLGSLIPTILSGVLGVVPQLLKGLTGGQ